MTKLRNACGEEEQESGQSVRTEFVSGVLERARAEWPEEQSAQEKWRMMKAAMVDTAGEILGKVKKRQPDWFQASEDHLRSYLLARNSAYRKWLASADRKDLIWFREARGKARREVRREKEEWLKRKAQEAERERFWGKRLWDNIRDLQRAKRGRIPARVVTVQDEDGRPCDTTTEQHERWRRHFDQVLNIPSQCNASELQRVKRPLDHELDRLPYLAEVKRAMWKLKSGKAPGSSGILPEMVKAGTGDEDFLGMMCDLVSAVWEERRVPKEWVDAILIPIPKKGDLRNCDNWRGISLLEVVGKVVARVVQQRLQGLAERAA